VTKQITGTANCRKTVLYQTNSMQQCFLNTNHWYRTTVTDLDPPLT